MKKLLVFLLCLCTLGIQAQTWTARPNVSTNGQSNGFYEYKPLNYATNTSEKYPLIIFSHGLGEQGNGNTQLTRLLSQGLPKLINNGQFPATFSVNGQTHSFIVIAPQYTGWPAALALEQTINYAVANYRVDTNRIYLTGLSMGGGVTWDYVSSSALRASRPAAILPICGALSPGFAQAQIIANAKLPVFATHNVNDPAVTSSYTTNWVDYINSYGQIPAARKQIWNRDYHDAWTDTYDPTYKLDAGIRNAYEWLLLYSKGSGATAPTGPSLVKIAGGPAYSDWLADANFLNGGSESFITNTGIIWGAPQAIPGAAPGVAPIYQSERVGSFFGYTIPISSGTYTVRLHFNDIYWQTVGSRVFNVNIEGARVLSNFDILSYVPRFSALQREFQVNVTDGNLQIDFTSVKDKAKINGIEIFPSTGPPPPVIEDSIRRTIRAVITTEYRDSATNQLLSTIVNSFYFR